MVPAGSLPSVHSSEPARSEPDESDSDSSSSSGLTGKFAGVMVWSGIYIYINIL